MEEPAMGRPRFIHNANLEERLALEAQFLKEQAEALPPGRDREMLLRRARQTETASHITEWLSSPGLTSPK
jgi:hypothetical protein